MPSKADPASFYTLHNMRQSRTAFGCLEQVPYFTSTTLTQGTYYDATSKTEPTTSAVRMLARVLDGATTLQVTDYVLNQNGTQKQVFYQSTQPATETIYTGCLLVIDSISGLGITLGSTLDVEMTATATFRWRKNGGAYTSGLVPSTTGVSIDGGNATLYFLANTGFAGTETWAWTRTDCSREIGGAVTQSRERPLPWRCTVDAIYFINITDRVMKFVSDTVGTYYAISLGYRAIYGSFLEIFSDRLYVQDASNAWTAFNDATKLLVIKNSDKSDYDDFISTDVNEADTITLPVIKTSDDQSIAGIGMCVLNQYLYVFTSNGMYYTPDLGLPLVHNYKPFGGARYTVESSQASQSIISARDGVYVLTLGGIYFFNGVDFKDVGRPIIDMLTPEATTWFVFGVYSLVHDELYVFPYSGAYTNDIFCYQARYSCWYKRAGGFNSTNPYGATCATVSYTENALVSCGASSRRVISENNTWTSAPTYDTGGTSYATPEVITQVYTGGSLSKVKETISAYLAPNFNFTSQTPHANFAALTDVRFKLSWATTNDGTIGSFSTDANAVLQSTSVDGRINFPRVLSFRGLAVKVTIIDVNGTEPPAECMLNGIELDLYQADTPR